MKLINNIFYQPSEDISGILSGLEKIRQQSDLVNCVFRATGSSWLGVNIAGWSMFPYQTIEIPQYYSNQILTDDQIEQLCGKIVQLGFKKFVLHGFSPYMSKIILGLKERSPELQVLLVHHGFVSELSENESQIRSIRKFIALFKSGKIDRLGVVKKGHEILFNKIFGIPASLLYNKVPVYLQSLRKRERNKIHIGVLVNETFRKNLHVQVMAGLLCENAIIHVLDKSELYYLNAGDRIVAHGMMPHMEYMALLASMDINLHVTYSESFGGQVFTESLGYGVPCLTGYTNGFLDEDHELKSLLSVSEADDPVAISNRIREILPLLHQLSGKLKEHCVKMNMFAEDCLNSFLHQ